VDRKLGPEPSACVCVIVEPGALATPDGLALRANASMLSVEVGTTETCPVHADVALSRPQLDRAIDVGHFASASLVGFARGLNDTPKILGLLVGAAVVAPVTGALAITVAMSVGGLVAAQRVTHTMSRRLTRMSPGEGLAGNLATSLLVVGASRLGVPVSTTHVSTGGIFGIGLTNGELRKRAAGQVLLAWVTTLPVAAALAAGAMAVIAR
jgi:PiT family inorganic phosphate transporter